MKKRDPYLIPGQVCEVWNGEKKSDYSCILRFNGYSKLGELQDIPFPTWQNYRPIGTEWDFAPDWALNYKNKNVCSVVDCDGVLHIYSNSNYIIPFKSGAWVVRNSDMRGKQIICGICPDKNRLKNWKESLRIRPEWAKVV